ncbi:hypothetical protein MNBD_GAMMA23-878 [hydrothermal vent metagenome]|uniref:DUF2066 domain-containing protein n=1 Tax=hydrothermal vent metagenome TaxID=652676 RepID=A0A3B0ZXB4_9ZZZZ
MNCLVRVWIGVLGFGGLFMSQSVLAAKITDLYEAEIPVLSQNRADRHVAIQQAFAEVLVRVSGQQDVVLALPPLIEADALPLKKTPNQQQPKLVLVGKTAEIAGALNRATFYVKQFRYQKTTGRPHIDWGIKPLDADKTKSKKSQQVLWIRFNKKKINKLLHRANLPVWGSTRPSILVWMVVESRGKRYLLSNSIKSTTRESIEKHARLYGLPVRFPLMDLADRANISTSDVWGNFEDRVMEASRRYQAEAILVGKIYQVNRAWNTQWHLYVNGRRVDWQEQAVYLTKVVKQGLSHTAQNLSLAFADVKTEKGIQQVLVKIKEVNGLAGYSQAVKYLSSISAVKKVQTVQVEKSSVLFNLTTQGSRVGVMQAIALGNQLVAEPNTIPRQAATAIPMDTAVRGEHGVVKAPPKELIPDLIYRLLQ